MTTFPQWAFGPKVSAQFRCFPKVALSLTGLQWSSCDAEEEIEGVNKSFKIREFVFRLKVRTKMVHFSGASH